ncbi:MULTISPECIES: CU044_5270 family protein [unclassified Streptomyces]|uniref:CU044_5270 family protein n=1 Tax=unclassified Streptomyces TaxID=2593676 RepID=UPI002885FE80|nr:CU044_5270 family protein [Streptomyces sp. DSM 41633]
MNANLSQPQPGEWEERAHLLPPVERELPAGRHQFHRNRLMAVIRDDLRDRRTTGAAPARTTRRPGPRLRRAILLPVAVCVLAGTVVAGVRILSDQGGTVPAVATGPVLTTRIGAANPAGAAQLLDRISLAAAEVSGPAVRKDQYIYIGVQQANTYVRTDRGKNTLVSQEPHLRQTWNSPDGAKGWLIEPGNTGPGGLTLDRATKSGKPPQPYLNAPTHDYLATLPTDPDVLLQKIYTETEGMGRTPDQEAFATIGDLLRASHPPAALTAALYKAAAKIPGVVQVDEAVDAAGRHGVAVAHLDETSGQRTEWIFDKDSLVFLGERTVQVSGSSGEGGLIKPGTVVSTSAVLTRAVVDRIKETPAGSR